MDQTTLERCLADLPLGPLRYFDRIGSTNTEAARWAEAGAPDLALVIADEQTEGRGRQGRKWFTPAGAALAFSLILKKAIAWEVGNLQVEAWVARLTALGALAVSQALSQDYGLGATIKWPNDVLLERRKVAGILAESHWRGEQLEAVILGMGVNVAPAAAPPENEIIFPATCIEAALGEPVSRLALLHAILAHLLEWRERLSDPLFVHTWDKRLAFRDEWVQIIPSFSSEAQPARIGLLLGLDSHGRLRLRGQDDEVFTVHSGEVHLRPVNGFLQEH